MTDLATGPVAADIRRRLEAALAPNALTLIDESAAHQGHAGHDGRGESHFRLEIESKAFVGQSRVARQRLVYAALGELMAGRVHAVTLRTRAPGDD